MPGRRLSVGTVADAADDLKSECLRLGAFAVVRAGQRLQALGKADEADGERAVLEHLAHLVVRAELFGVQPDALPHQEGEIAHAAAALDLEPLEQLADDKVEHLIKAAEKASRSPRARMASRGRLMDVKERLPRRAVTSREGS